MKNFYLLLVIAFLSFTPKKLFDNSYQTLPFSQNWSTTTLITTNDIWTGVPGIQGFLGDFDPAGSVTGVDPQTVLVDMTNLDVIANQSNPNTQTAGGVAEFDGIADPVIALQGSATADGPNMVIYLNTTGMQSINVAYNLRDIDGSADNAIQPVALQYRIGTTGNFTNIPAAFVADATTGPSLASLVTPVNAGLPAACNNEAQVQIRILTTNAVGSDEWVGIDDISITGTPIVGTTATLANMTPQASGNILQGTTNAVLTGFTVSATASVDFTNVTVTSTGTATNTDISNVRIFRDNDANGSINGSDASVSGAGIAYAASMGFTITGETGITTSRQYLIVADIAGGATVGNTVTASIAPGDYTTTAANNTGSATGNSRIISSAISSSASDYFRSRVSGDWNVPATWESSPDNGTTPWITATLSPDANANTVTILNGHTVANTANGLSIDQLVIATGGQLIINPTVTWTLANGTGTDLSISGTLLNQGSTWTIGASGAWEVLANGTYIHNTAGGIATPLGAATLNAASNFIYRGSSTITPSISLSGRTYGNLSFESTSGTWSSSPSGGSVLTVQGNFLIGTDVTINNALTGANVFAGNFTINGTLTNSTGTQSYNFTGVGKSIAGSAALVSFETANIQTGASITLLRNIEVASTFTFTVNIGSTLEMGLFQLGGAGNVVINGTVGIEHLGGFAGAVNATGSKTLSILSTVNYKATTGVQQSFTYRNDYGNVILGGTTPKIAVGAFNEHSIVFGLLTFSTTTLTTSILNNIILAPTATFTGASNASHINGPMGRSTNNTIVYTFPVGKGGVYRPFDLIPSNSPLSLFGGEYHNTGFAPSPLCNPARLQAYTDNEWWDVIDALATGTLSAKVSLNYVQANSSGNWFDGTNPAPDPDATRAITVGHLTGGCVQDENDPAGILSGDAISGTVTSKLVALGFTPNPFTFAYGPLIVLPVNFGRISAMKQGTGVKVDFSNETETRVLGYTVERSANGRDFSSIGNLSPVKNDGTKASYSFIDHTPLDGLNYYRIRSLELDGIQKHSSIVKLDLKANSTLITIFPNPSGTRDLSLQATVLEKGNYMIRIYNSAGQQVYNRALQHSGGSVTEPVSLPSLRAGTYQLILFNDNVQYTQRFILQ